MSQTATQAPAFRPAAPASQRAWLWAGGLTVASWLLLGWLYRDTAASMVAIWLRSDTYAHGFLVLPISAFLIWRKRRELAAITPEPQWLGVVALAGLSLVWLAGHVADILLAAQLALVAMLPATAWALLGTAAVRTVLFPLAFLVFAVPWGEAWTPWLQDVTAAISVWCLDITGIPVFREGRHISIPAGDFLVAETCSGLRYLIASLALGSLYAYLTYRSPWRRLAFFAVAAVVPILGNGLRAYGVMFLGHLTDMRWGTGDEHVVLGRVFFITLMVLLFWLGALWRETPAAATPDRRAGTRPLRARALVPVALAVLGIGAAGSGLAGLAAGGGETARTRVVLPEGAHGWSGPLTGGTAWQPRFRGADLIREAAYRRGPTSAVDFLVVHYRRQEQGAELVNAQNRLFSGDWRWLGGDPGRVVAGPEGQRWPVRELRLQGPDGRRQLVWRWYDIGGRRLVDPTRAKLWEAAHRLLGRSGDTSLVAVAAGFRYRPEQARKQLRAFLAAHPATLRGRGVVRLANGSAP